MISGFNHNQLYLLSFHNFFISLNGESSGRWFITFMYLFGCDRLGAFFRLSKVLGGECDGHTCGNSAWVVRLDHSIGCY